MLPNRPIQSVQGDLDRRWLFDDYFDLIVWYRPDRQIQGFQLCYDKPRHERALTWTPREGFSHSAIDTGESNPGANRTPILAANGPFPREEVECEFLARSLLLPADIRALVLEKIAEYGEHRGV